MALPVTQPAAVPLSAEAGYTECSERVPRIAESQSDSARLTGITAEPARGARRLPMVAEHRPTS